MAESTSNPIYRVARWAETFETHESRRYKTLTWVSWPIDVQSNGYQLMVDYFSDEATTVYGAWAGLIVVAAKCPIRGVLATNKGVSYSPERIARLAHMPAEPFCKLIPWALSESVGWLEVMTPEQFTGLSPGYQRVDCTATEPNVTEPNVTFSTTKDGGVLIDDAVYGEIFPFVASALSAFKVRSPKDADSRLLLVATALAKEQRLPTGALSNLVLQVSETRDVKNPFAMLRKMLNGVCEDEGFELQRVMNLTKIPKPLLKLPKPEPASA